ncbi:MAG: mechanosensitive ion channel [bacterium]
MSELVTQFIDWCQQHLGISAKLLSHAVWTILALLVYIAFRLVGSLAIHRRVGDVSRKYVITKYLNYTAGFAFVFAVIVIWFGNITGWAAYLGLLSAGLAVALQDPVTNLAGWIFISIRRPFTVGDRIQIGDHRGDVIDMRLFQFSLVEIGNWVSADQSTGRIIHIPNGWIFKHSTANYTAGFNFIWNELPITVTFESDWAKAKKILTDIAEKHSILKGQQAQDQVRQASRKYMIYFQHLTPIVWTSVADIGVTLTIRYICEPRRRRSSEGAIWEDVLAAFSKEDSIDFAYPTTRYYDNVAEGKPGARATPPSE